MKKKHIAFLVASLNIGGVESVFVAYANALVELGYLVDFVVAKNEGDLKNNLSSKVNLVHFNGIKMRKIVPYLRNYIKTSNVDVVISGPDITNMIAVFCVKILPSKTKLIITQHNIFDNDAKDLGLIGTMIPTLKRIFYRFADHILSVSNGVTEDLLKLKLPKSKISTIHNPIDLELIKKKSLDKINYDLPPKYITFVGRLSNVKNIPLLIKSFDLLKDKNIELIIVGSGSEELKLKDLASKMNSSNRIKFIGAVNDPAPIIFKSQIVVVPSFSEAFPMVVIESLALGKTVVHTPNKGCVEIMEPDGGYCSDTFTDEHKFAQTIEYGISNLISEKVLHSKVRNLSFDYILPKLEKLINS